MRAAKIASDLPENNIWQFVDGETSITVALPSGIADQNAAISFYNTKVKDTLAGGDGGPTPSEPAVQFIPVPLLRQRIEKLELWDDFCAYLILNPAAMLKVLTLEAGVDPSYPDLVQAFSDLHVPSDAQAYILAPPSAGVPDV